MLKSIASQIPLDEVRELAHQLLERGVSVGEVVDQIAELLDGLVDWRKVIRGPAGMVAEAGDGPLLRALLGVIVAQVARGRAG